MAEAKSSQSKKSYYADKNKLIKWALIYLVLGGLVYAIIYLLFFHGSSSSGSSGTLPY